VDELLLLAERMPDEIRKRAIERPDVFRKIARLDDEALDWLVETIDRAQSEAT
jgi:hypothetical protein